jgi:ketosteroid isomerase-like protein
MSEQEQNIELVKKGYEAFAAGDIDTVMSLFDDNTEWVQPGDSAISGTYHGKRELGELVSRLAEKSTTVTPRRYFADGDTVVMLGETAADNETSEAAQVFTLREGKIVRSQVYGDTALVERIYGKKEVATA